MKIVAMHLASPERMEEGRRIVALLNEGRIAEALELASPDPSRPLSAQAAYDSLWRGRGRRVPVRRAEA